MDNQAPARRIYGIAVDWSVLLQGVAEVEDVFRKCPQWGNVDMGCGDMAFGCGVSSCVAAWYLREAFVTEHVPRKYRGKLDFSNDFEHGSYSLCCELGFDWSRRPSLARDKTPVDITEDFFRENADLWGNEYGHEMFYEARAYGKHNYEPFTVKDVLHHWQGVRSRIYSIKYFLYSSGFSRQSL